MDYKGYKLIDKIILVGKTPRKEEAHMQAYLVDPSNKKQLESAQHWAKWTEYGPYDRTTRKYEWTVEHNGTEFEFDNNGFTLELLDCAGGSSQGGKLSFWNCLVSKNEQTFMIGINSDMLLDLLKNATFINGKCQSELVFITCKGKVGMTVKGSDTYEQCIKDNETRINKNANATAKYSFGDLISTTTLNEVYLGTLTQYYVVERDDPYRYNYSIRNYTIKKLAKPKTYHLFESVTPWCRNFSKLSEIADYYSDDTTYGMPDFKTNRPKRLITGKIELDCTEVDFFNKLFAKIYNFDSYKKRYNLYINKVDEEDVLKRFLNTALFGFGKEPFELPEEIMALVKNYGIKYIEE